MINAIKRFFTKEDFRLVKVLECNGVETSYYILGNTTKVDGIIYYYLYEGDRGNRKCKISTTFKNTTATLKDNEEEDAKRLVLYLSTVQPWLDGRYDPDIQSYNQVPHEAMANKLRGSVE